MLNASRRGTYRKLLREHLSIKPPNYVHKELAPGRIKKDMEAVEKGINLLENVFTNPWNGRDLTSLSTGIEATTEVRDSLLGAKNGGFSACLDFISTRCSSSPKLDFFDPLPKSKYKTFKDLKKVVKVSAKDRVLPLKMDRTLFARMALSGQFRKIDLKTVFMYPLGPLPWSLADAYGLLRKTNKAQLFKKLEKNVPALERHPTNVSNVYDTMAILQKLKLPAGATFRLMAEKVFSAVTNNTSRRIDVVFDIYPDISIKNAERSKRSARSESVRYKNILPGHPIKSWSKFLTVSSNKTEVVKFLVTEWKRDGFTYKLVNRSLFVTHNEECWKLQSSSISLVPELKCSHEEADTRMILHAKHIQGPVLIHADDTDVLVLLLSHSNVLGDVYIKTGRGSKSRIIQIKRIVENLTKDLGTGIRVQDFLKSLSGLHAITGCDSVSDFAGKGKAKALKLLMKSRTYVDAFMDLGLSWNINDETVNGIEGFVCELYGKKMQEVNLLRYQLHCAKAGKVEPEGLPPCKSSLQLHTTRANYQAGIWRRAIFPLPEVPLPSGHGWEIAEGK